MHLFRANTEEEFARLEALGVQMVTETIETFRRVTGSPEYQENVRQLEKARLEAINARAFEREQGRKEERQKWHSIVDEKDREIARLRSMLDGQSN
jgi:hypothetical protein